MMIQTDTKENSIFKYFYVSKFKWSSLMSLEENGGHPKEKKVYRGWVNTDTNTFRLNTQDHLLLCLGALVQTAEEQGYTSDIKEISLDSILDLNIQEECLDNIIKWSESDNQDLKKLLFNPGNNVPIEIIRIVNSAVNKKPQLDGIIEALEELAGLDPVKFDGIWELVDHLNSELYEEVSIDAESLKNDPRHSSSINIYNAFQSLNRYIGSNRKTNKDRVDLLKALSSILTELSNNEE